MALLVPAATLAACGTVPTKASPTDPAGNYFEVTQGLWRGGRPDQAGVEVLAQQGFKTIIDLENVDDVVAQEKSWATGLGIDHVNIPMSGLSKPTDAQVDQALAIMNDPAKQPVFIHCMQGKDRTGLVVALYRVYMESWTPKDAWDEALNHGFNTILLALKDYFEDRTHYDN